MTLLEHGHHTAPRPWVKGHVLAPIVRLGLASLHVLGVGAVVVAQGHRARITRCVQSRFSASIAVFDILRKHAAARDCELLLSVVSPS